MTEKDKVKEFLDALRESGVTNMFGAAPYLEEEFDFTNKQARDHLSQWMMDFNAAESDEDTDLPIG
jgi:hypothetical protein